MGKLGGGEQNGQEGEIKSFVFRAGLPLLHRRNHTLYIRCTPPQNALSDTSFVDRDKNKLWGGQFLSKSPRNSKASYLLKF